jgi:hypothetical protein
MKIVEFTNGLQLPITNEEADMLGKFDDTEQIVLKNSLSDREQVIANQLVNKGVLVRRNQDGKIQYRKQVNS